METTFNEEDQEDEEEKKKSHWGDPNNCAPWCGLGYREMPRASSGVRWWAKCADRSNGGDFTVVGFCSKKCLKAGHRRQHAPDAGLEPAPAS